MIEELPTEIIIHISLYLELQCVSNLLIVCREIHDSLKRPSHWYQRCCLIGLDTKQKEKNMTFEEFFKKYRVPRVLFLYTSKYFDVKDMVKQFSDKFFISEERVSKYVKFKREESTSQPFSEFDCVVVFGGNTIRNHKLGDELYEVLTTTNTSVITGMWVDSSRDERDDLCVLQGKWKNICMLNVSNHRDDVDGDNLILTTKGPIFDEENNPKKTVTHFSSVQDQLLDGLDVDLGKHSSVDINFQTSLSIYSVVSEFEPLYNEKKSRVLLWWKSNEKFIPALAERLDFKYFQFNCSLFKPTLKYMVNCISYISRRNKDISESQYD